MKLVKEGDEWVVTSDAESDVEVNMEQEVPNDDANAEPVEGEAHPPLPHSQPRPQRMRALPKPVAPTKAQREAHELCHMPYATWCPFCVKARGQNQPHRKVKKHASDHTVPTVSGDFGFLTRQGEDKSNPFFVLRDHQTRVTFCHQVQGKSATNELYS